MKYVYILSTYEEHGAENVHATLDLSRVIKIIEDWPRKPGSSPLSETWHKDWIAEAVASAGMLLLHTNEFLAEEEDGHELHCGWGGIMLHVVKLT